MFRPEHLVQLRGEQVVLTRDDLSPELVSWASAATQIKFVLYALMLLMLLAVGARALWRQRRALR